MESSWRIVEVCSFLGEVVGLAPYLGPMYNSALHTVTVPFPWETSLGAFLDAHLSLLDRSIAKGNLNSPGYEIHSKLRETDCLEYMNRPRIVSSPNCLECPFDL